MTITVENDGGDVANVDALCFGNNLEILGGREFDTAEPDEFRANSKLVHVDTRARIEHRSLFRQSDHSECIAASLGRKACAVDWVDGDVAFGRRAIADALAVVEHWGFVFFAFADDDGSIH